jgi:anionic cell wall polymer biosynthesis LytR-Cps2A-Psr (LCP) family protein
MDRQTTKIIAVVFALVFAVTCAIVTINFTAEATDLWSKKKVKESNEADLRRIGKTRKPKANPSCPCCKSSKRKHPGDERTQGTATSA